MGVAKWPRVYPVIAYKYYPSVSRYPEVGNNAHERRQISVNPEQLP